MSQKVSIAYQVSAAPNTSNYVTIYTVPAARKLRNNELTIFFPSGTGGNLSIALYFGNQQVLPTAGFYAGDNTTITDDSEAVWFSGSVVKLFYQNKSTTSTLSAYILLRGELE